MTQLLSYLTWTQPEPCLDCLNIFEKASELKLNVKKTEAMWIGSLQNCENEPLGVKWKTCVKFFGIYITYNVQILVEKNFKQRLKNIKNTINLWKSRGLSIYGKVSIIKTLLLPKMIYPSSVICTPYEVIKEFNSLIFRFLCSFSSSFWNETCEKILNKLNGCVCLSLEYRDIILGF